MKLYTTRFILAALLSASAVSAQRQTQPASPLQPGQTTDPFPQPIAAADGVMVVPPHGVQLGETVPAFALPWGPAIPEPRKADSKAKAPPRRAGNRSAGKPAADSGPVDWSALLD